MLIGRADGKTRKLYRADTLYDDISVGRNFTIKALLRSTPDINNDLVSCTKHIIRWSRYVHCRLECQQFIIEQITTKDLILINQILEIGNRVYVEERH